jgi:FtsP/CotA-like multicopper oxidase with cupredoxin domain
MRRLSWSLAAAASALALATAARAAEYRLVVDEATVTIEGRAAQAIAINGSVPAPTLRFKEGEEAVVHVTNRLAEPTSIHWHGLILPAREDGAPGFSGFQAIQPGETYTYRIPIKQNGTYWYHSHSAGQEQAGMYGAIVIEPRDAPAVRADRDHVVVFSDFTRERPDAILRNLKADHGYYNPRQAHGGRLLPRRAQVRPGRRGRRPQSLGRDADGRHRPRRRQRLHLPDQRQGTAGGRDPAVPPGERVRLRFVNASAMSYLDLRIPGLKMTVVAADGRDVQPVAVDEIRMAVAETYDVIVEPTEERAYALMAEPLDRSGFALATLAPREGLRAPTPERRPRALLTMADMGAHGGGHGDPHAGHAAPPAGGMDHSAHVGMDHSAHAGMDHSAPPGERAGCARCRRSLRPHARAARRLPAGERGGGRHRRLRPAARLGRGLPAGVKVLSYADLKPLKPQTDTRAPSREIVVRLTGDMNRYVWTLNGKKFSEADPVRLTYGERVRLTFVNETMMAHPMHLHGMFFQAETGPDGATLPDKHVLSVEPGKTASVLLSADAPGEWAFHCHLLFHMSAGMMTRLVVATLPEAGA